MIHHILTSKRSVRKLRVLTMFLLSAFQSIAQNTPAKSETFTIEGYYKVKWGYAEEFIDLYKRNHYPLLKKSQEKGDIISVTAEKPRLHDTEEARWDFKITIVFKNVQAAFDPTLTDPYKKQLYPDLDKLEKDERHRFELLIAHWDVEVQPVDLEKTN